MALLDARDVRMLIPQIRRRLDPGVPTASAASGLTDEDVRDIAADAVNERVLIGGTSFPYVVSVASADGNTGLPVEYLVDPELPLALQQLVSIQAALGQVFSELRGLVSQEKISSEGASWEVTRSVQTLRDKVKWLQDERNLALKEARQVIPTLDTVFNILAARTSTIDAEIETFG
jgi:hypothetical protein